VVVVLVVAEVAEVAEAAEAAEARSLLDHMTADSVVLVVEINRLVPTQ
jgi:hypothetical protein